MRRFLQLLTICLFATPFLLIALLFQAIEAQPRIVRQVTLSPQHIAHAKQLIDTHLYQANPGVLTTASILSRDADIATNYLVNRFGNGSAQVLFSDRHALIRLCLPIPTSLINGYLNFEITLMQMAGLPQLQTVHVGNLILPDFITHLFVSQLTKWVQQNSRLYAVADAIKLVQISPDKVNIVYRWENKFSQDKYGIPLIDKQERARLFRYHTLLARISKQSNTRTISLAEILPPLMQLAARHSIKGDAPLENRAVLLVTAFHVLGMPLKLLIPEAANWPRANNQIVTLDQRDDFAKHFILSAAITAYTDTTLSDAIGLYKELEDSRSGSGFSFNDIAADRAGTRFGEKAVANQTTARRLQQLVAPGLDSADLMPPWSDLPEFMSETEFKQRYGGLNMPTYQKMMQDIEKRVSALPILR